MNVEAHSSNKELSSEKHLDSLQEQDKHHISQSQSSLAPSVDTSTQNSYQKRSKILGRFYSGIQREIYD